MYKFINLKEFCAFFLQTTEFVLLIFGEVHLHVMHAVNDFLLPTSNF